MNNQQTLDKLKKMRLHTMAHHHQQHLQGHQHDQWTNDEYLAMLIDHEWEDRQQRKTDRLIKNAAMRQQATLAEVDYLRDGYFRMSFLAALRNGSMISTLYPIEEFI